MTKSKHNPSPRKPRKVSDTPNLAKTFLGWIFTEVGKEGKPQVKALPVTSTISFHKGRSSQKRRQRRGRHK